MLSTKVTVILFISLFIFKINASDIDTLTETVTNHSIILNQFPECMKKISSLEKKTRDMESSVIVIEVDTLNLQADLSELTDVSIAYTEKLNSFVSSEINTIKLESMYSYLQESFDKHRGDLNSLGSQHRRTKTLEAFTADVKEEVVNNVREGIEVTRKLESVKKNYTDAQKQIKTKVQSIDAVDRQQNALGKKLDEFLAARTDVVAQTTSSILKNCTAEQLESKAKLEELEKLPKLQKETKMKLVSLISQVEKENDAANKNLELLQTSFNAEHNEIKKQAQRIDPLKNSQQETSKKLDEMYHSLKKMAEEQAEQEKLFKQISQQLQSFIASHATL